MKNLTNTTFITAVKIESQDRYENAKSVLGFLNHHFNTNVLIYEMCDGESRLGFIDDLKNLNIRVIKDSDSKVFHRTKFLNILLKEVETKVTCNYDIDVIFPVEVYLLCEKLLFTGVAEMVYPYKNGEGQIRVFQGFNRNKFNEIFDTSLINDSTHRQWATSFCGHAMFMITEAYKRYGGENENFISYGPEDRERLMRFEKLGAKIARLEDGIVYHFEHSRGPDSGGSNPYFNENNREFSNINRMSPEEIRRHLPSI